MNIKIYQIDRTKDTNRVIFENYDNMLKINGGFDFSIYNCIYNSEVTASSLDDIYYQFNMLLPEDFKGHSLSVSDIVNITDTENKGWYYCDSYGFKQLDASLIIEPERKQRLYVDMDGTLATFRKLDTIEPLFEKGYFENLPPHMNVVNAVKEIIANNKNIEVFVMSAYLTDSQYALEEKNKWLDKYLPEIDTSHRVFCPCGADKKDFVKDGIKENDFLLDDYTANLTLWQPPARAIKLLNGINHTNGTWEYDRIDFNKEADVLAKDIIDIMQNGKTIKHDIPQKNSIMDYCKSKAPELTPQAEEIQK